VIGAAFSIARLACAWRNQCAEVAVTPARAVTLFHDEIQLPFGERMAGIAH
jgi:hypothetical protein